MLCNPLLAGLVQWELDGHMADSDERGQQSAAAHRALSALYKTHMPKCAQEQPLLCGMHLSSCMMMALLSGGRALIPVHPCDALLLCDAPQGVKGTPVQRSLAASGSAHAQAHVLSLQPCLHHPQRVGHLPCTLFHLSTSRRSITSCMHQCTAACMRVGRSAAPGGSDQEEECICCLGVEPTSIVATPAPVAAAMWTIGGLM